MGILFINGGEIGGNTAHLGHAFLEGRDFTQIDLAGKRLFFLFRGGAPTQQMYERGEYTINRSPACTVWITWAWPAMQARRAHSPPSCDHMPSVSQSARRLPHT